MERLTLVIPTGGIWLLDDAGIPCTYIDKDDDTYKHIKRLSEYEDIGLIPEQIKEVDRLYAEKCRELTELQRNKGNLLKLPCAVGDTVYEINRIRNAVSEFTVKGFDISKYGIFVEWVLVNGIYNNLSGFNDSEIGKTVFLTQAEAEAALKKQ